MGLWAWVSYPFRRGPRRPLSARQPRERMHHAQKPLGMEATDLNLVEAVNRRNASLERVSTFFRPGAHRYSLEDAETRITPFADDENYATRYHRAYNQKKGQ